MEIQKFLNIKGLGFLKHQLSKSKCFLSLLHTEVSKQLVPHLAVSPRSPLGKKGKRLAGKQRLQAGIAQKKPSEILFQNKR